jgi:hypothetical protein
MSDQKEEQVKGRNKWVKRIFWVLMVLIILPLLLTALLNVPFVQNWAVDKTATYLSTKTESQITLGEININVFEGVQLNNFVVREMNGDTVMACGTLSASLAKNLFSLYYNQLKIHSVRLDKAKLNLVRDAETRKINLVEILDRLKSKNKSTKSNFLFDIKQVHATNLSLKFFDKATSYSAGLLLDEGKVKVQLLDIAGSNIIVDQINLLRPRFTSKAGLKTLKTLASPAKKESSSNLCIQLEDLWIKDGTLKHDNNNLPFKQGYQFDQNHINVAGITTRIDNLRFSSLFDIQANIHDISFATANGFRLKNLKAPGLIISDRIVQMRDFTLLTDNTSVKSNVSLTYPNSTALMTLDPSVTAQINLHNSTIALYDVSYFVPSLLMLPVFNRREDKKAYIHGNLSGTASKLLSENMNISIGNDFLFEGSLALEELNHKSNLKLNIGAIALETNMDFLAKSIPGFNPPKNFYALETIKFKGTHKGTLKNFTTIGILQSAIGNADLDVSLNVANGSENAEYNGKIHLEDFNVGKWANAPDLGKLSVQANIKDGKSLFFSKASANVQATIESLVYKDYTYKDVSITGDLSPNTFEGKLLSNDPNIDLSFEGKLKLNKDNKEVDFRSQIKSLDFEKLHLSKSIKFIKGDVAFKGSGNDLNSILGDFIGKDLVVKKGDSTYFFTAISLSASQLHNGHKKMHISSEHGSLNLVGKYNLNTLVNDLKSLAKTNFPYHTRAWHYTPTSLTEDQDFSFDLYLVKGNGLLDLLDMKDIYINVVNAEGKINSSTSSLYLKAFVPKFGLKDQVFSGINVLADVKKSVGDLKLDLDSSIVSNTRLKSIKMDYAINGDAVNFDIQAHKIIDSLQRCHIKGTLVPHDKGYTIGVTHNEILIFNKRWKINNQSKISIGNKYLDLQNVDITDGIRNISLVDLNDNKGVKLTLDKIDVSTINPLIKSDKIQFKGELSSVVKVDDIFDNNTVISGNAHIPSLMLNTENYGEVNLDLAKDKNAPLDVLLSISREDIGQALKIGGKYDLNTKQVDATVKAKNVSLKFLEFLLKTGITNVKGGVDLDGTITGKINNLKIDTKGLANGGSVKVIYLGETYTFDKQPFTLTERRIDMTGATLSDSEGNIGTIEGGLNHKLFKDFILDVSIAGENVIAINTTKFDNPVYYGVGKGTVNVDFQGPTSAAKMIINAVTTSGTVINIPIKESKTAIDKSFITFIDKEAYFKEKSDSTNTKAEIVKVEGVSIEMNLTMTEDAVVNMIFDEYKNDIITGEGNGNLRISMSNKGEFDMFGTYTITSGDYLFTALNVVNKPFKVREGGTIRWTGDPINATLDIIADYQVRTPLSSFLAEYLSTDQLEAAAAVSTPVNLKMLLGNTLYNPIVKFDLDFPELAGELRSYTDSKLRLLRNNEADFNSQVFGLIVFNTFLPSNTLSDVVGTNFLQNASINTLSEFVGSQFSMLVTGFINEALTENGLISGIDFEMNLRNRTTFSGGNNTSLVPSEIEVRVKNRFRFLDERLQVNVGGNYIRQGQIIELSNYVVPEFFLEYAITEDKKLNLKLYGKYDYDEINYTSRRQKYGLGLRYKTEFGSLVETKAKLKAIIKKNLKK